MRATILAIITAPLLLLAVACTDHLVTAPDEALLHHRPGHGGDDGEATSNYSLLTLDTRWSRTTGINDAAIVVGRKIDENESDEWHAALWDAVGNRTTLPIPRSSFVGINNQGMAIGYETDDRSSYFNVHRRGFIYRDGSIAPISGEHLDEYDEFGDVFLTGSLDDDRVQPWDHNDHGIVIARGLFEKEDGTWRRYAFAWQEGSPISYIKGGQPTAINSHGQVVGFAWFSVDPVIWQEGAYDEPQVIPGLRDHFPDHEIELWSINDSGQILGFACKRNDGRGLCGGGSSGSEHRGFVLDGGTVVELPLPHHATGLRRLGGLNEGGRVVGMVRKREGNSTNEVPILWTVTSTGASLQELPRGDYSHASATAINNHDHVSGEANPWEALRWTPTADDGEDDECTHPRGRCE